MRIGDTVEVYGQPRTIEAIAYRVSGYIETIGSGDVFPISRTTVNNKFLKEGIGNLESHRFKKIVPGLEGWYRDGYNAGINNLQESDFSMIVDVHGCPSENVEETGAWERGWKDAHQRFLHPFFFWWVDKSRWHKAGWSLRISLICPEYEIAYETWLEADRSSAVRWQKRVRRLLR